MKFTEALAIYAAVLSTSVFFWNITQSRPRLRVDVLPGTQGLGPTARFGFFIIVRNVSPHPVHISTVDVLYPYTRIRLVERASHLWRFRRLPRRLGWVHDSLAHYEVDTGCPARLEARSSHRVFLPEETVERILTGATERTFIACVQDQLWNDVFSRAAIVPAPSRS